LNYFIEFNDCSTDDPGRWSSDDANKQKSCKYKMKPVDKSKKLKNEKCTHSSDKPDP